MQNISELTALSPGDSVMQQICYSNVPCTGE